jgi:hypothetical protein
MRGGTCRCGERMRICRTVGTMTYGNAVGPPPSARCLSESPQCGADCVWCGLPCRRLCYSFTVTRQVLHPQTRQHGTRSHPGLYAVYGFNPFPPTEIPNGGRRVPPAVESAPGVARTRPMAPRDSGSITIRKVATSALGCRLGHPVCRCSMEDALPQGMPSR